ncbi:trypsin-like peptidase domain-containing protein [Pseudanabaena sp. BC1403]|uniref:trypsin-like peptidase domain-containing protein n=1 Tax=Pseudanabaena sp. BC1403 TaxID=2043171 RepID=UPI000CD91A09|nr:trypsin-like peptidase domain-containing protein [Pseudanabaena sp. BC1403]
MASLSPDNLHTCTVKLSIDNTHGTGFFVAAGLILTCHHVVKNAGDRPIKVRWQNQEDFAVAKVLQSFPDPVDLALLQFETLEALACVELDGAIAAFDDLFAYGYPDIDPNGAPVTLRYDGLNGDVPPKIKFSDGRVRSGLSGAPLLNPATGKVCGVVKYTEDRSLPLGGGGIPIATVFEYFPDLATQNRQFHQQQRGDVNPFQYGAPVSPDRFYGRVSAIADVKNRIGAISAQCVNIVGLRRSGKSSFLRYIKERPQVFFQDSQQPLIVLLDLQDSKFHDPYGLMEGLRRGIKAQVGTAPWGRGDNIDPYEVEDALLELRDEGYRLIVILDELESIGYRLDKFQDWGEDWRSKAGAGLFSLVVASRHPLSEIYKNLGLTSPFGNIFSTTVLGALEIEAWEKLLRDGFSSCGTDTLNLVNNLAGRLPFYTQMAAALIWQHGDVEVVKREFLFQVHSHWAGIFYDLSDLERHALRVAAGKSATAAAPVTRDWLQRYGLLGTNGELFSDVFAEFVRGLR